MYYSTITFFETVAVKLFLMFGYVFCSLNPSNKIGNYIGNLFSFHSDGVPEDLAVFPALSCSTLLVERILCVVASHHFVANGVLFIFISFVIDNSHCIFIFVMWRATQTCLKSDVT